MKKPEDVMEILEAYDLTGSFRAAAGLVGCDHKTVAYWVRQITDWQDSNRLAQATAGKGVQPLT